MSTSLASTGKKPQRNLSVAGKNWDIRKTAADKRKARPKFQVLGAGIFGHYGCKQRSNLPSHTASFFFKILSNSANPFYWLRFFDWRNAVPKVPIFHYSHAIGIKSSLMRQYAIVTILL